jgi:16S rRNA (cytidine1402-2'-O)-methyltransferase
MKDQAEASPGLYMVAGPIGNREDLGYRAVRLLAQMDWIAVEDTRETRKLLDAYGITRPLVSLHEHSAREKAVELAAKLREKSGRGAYLSDAGTPGVCDPGAALVREAVRAGVAVIPVPGPSAPVALLSVCGFEASSFRFHGFFPREKKDRSAWVEKRVAEGGLHVFFESPHRIQECLAALAEGMGQAELVVGRELTKKFETITRGTAAKVWELLAKKEPRGEYVLAIYLPEGEAKTKNVDVEPLLAELAALGASQKILVRVGVSHGLAKNDAYQKALKALGK